MLKASKILLRTMNSIYKKLAALPVFVLFCTPCIAQNYNGYCSSFFQAKHLEYRKTFDKDTSDQIQINFRGQGYQSCTKNQIRPNGGGVVSVYTCGGISYYFGDNIGALTVTVYDHNSNGFIARSTSDKSYLGCNKLSNNEYVEENTVVRNFELESSPFYQFTLKVKSVEYFQTYSPNF